MPYCKMTSALIRKLKCPPERRKIEYYDKRRVGFMVEVRATGGKTFYQRYSDARGRERQFRIGPVEVISLDQARRKAKQVVAEALLGPDPAQRRRDLRSVPTLKAFVAERYLPYIKTYKSSWQTDETVLRIHVLSRLGSRALNEVKVDAVAELVNDMRASGYAAGTINRAIVILRYIYNLAAKWKVPGAGDNPAGGLTAGPEVQRNRFLTEDEAKALILSIQADENRTAATCILLLLLTGARRNEITFARWEQIDRRAKKLLVSKSKSGKSRAVALNPAALELIAAVPRQPDCPWIFPSPVSGRPSSSLFFPWDRIRKRAGLEDLRLHDLRHSFASFLANRGVALYVIQNLLGHLHPRTTQRYAHLTAETLMDAADLVQDAIGVQSKR
jgi:integrase